MRSLPLKRLSLATALCGSLALLGCSSVPREEDVPQAPQPQQEHVSKTVSDPVAEVLQSVSEPVRARDFSAGNLRLRQASFSQLPDAEPADWKHALEAFRVSCASMGSREPWREVCLNAQKVPKGLEQAFFEGNFDLWQITVRQADGRYVDRGLMTGYYEPQLRASRRRHGVYQYPIYGVPDDLVSVELSSQYPQLKGLRLRGKLQGRKIVPYDERSGIVRRKDLLETSVLCWAEDPVEVFFLQIQGSGRILLDTGESIRLGYADQNGHPYRSLGGWLMKHAGLKREQMSMQRIKQWAKDNPNRRQELLNANPNFVFFRERTGHGEDLGPIGAQGLPLTPLASVAVDRRYWKLGVPFFTDVSQGSPAMRFARPVIAQDTGSAIKGVIRFDYFWGAGESAGAVAGRQKSDAKAWVMVPRGKSPAVVLSSGS